MIIGRLAPLYDLRASRRSVEDDDDSRRSDGGDDDADPRRRPARTTSDVPVLWSCATGSSCPCCCWCRPSGPWSVRRQKSRSSATTLRDPKTVCPYPTTDFYWLLLSFVIRFIVDIFSPRLFFLFFFTETPLPSRFFYPRSLPPLPID